MARAQTEFHLPQRKKTPARKTKPLPGEALPQVVSPHPNPGYPDIGQTLTGLEWYYSGISALEGLYRRQHGGYRFVTVVASLTELAKRIEKLVYPGIDGVDARADFSDGRYYFVCAEEGLIAAASSIPVLDFYWNPVNRRYADPRANYRHVRDKTWAPKQNETRVRYSQIFPKDIPGLAVFASRFMSGINPVLFDIFGEEDWPSFSIEEQRATLSLILSGPFSQKGLAILHSSGYTKVFLPELIAMDGTRHSKEGHPEGNVWEHSLETLKYRKITDLTLSLALLLHDSGKPSAVPTRQKMFDKHAELGAELASRLLNRLGFDSQLIRDVCWLIEYHMIPQALAELPLSRTQRLMEHPLFPLLLELYRCDLTSTWRGPEGYYEACKKFRTWLKTKNNPYLNLDRKRQIQRFVAS